MEASTPLNITNKHLNKERFAPLRRLSSLNRSAIPDTVEKSDDNSERERRRSQVRIQKRLSNIPSYTNSLNESVSEEEVNGHIQICIRLFADNKITTKNAWNLKIIDYLYKFYKSKDALPLVGTSLYVGASVFGVKVDDAHVFGMNLASTIVSRNDQNAKDGNVEDGDMDNEEDKENELPEKRKKKKPKRLIAGQKATIAKDPSSLLGPIPKGDSTFFQTQSKSELSAVDNLFTNRFPTDASGYRFIFDGKERAWIKPNDKDAIIDTESDKKFPVDLPQLTNNFKLCPAFADFDLATWNPDEEDKLMNDSHRSFRPNLEPLCYENGLPVAELDGSIHDIFENAGNDDNVDAEDILEEEEFAAHFQENVEHIVSLKPHAGNNLSDYSYNSAIAAQNGRIVDQIWAGPSHWKFKYIRPSTARFSGKSVITAEEQKQKRKRREKIASQTVSFGTEMNRFLDPDELKKPLSAKKKNAKSDAHKITLPLPIAIDLTCPLLVKPIVFQKKRAATDEDCEVKPYNYDNPNDSLYCSQKSGNEQSFHDDNDGGFNNYDDMDNDEQLQANFADNLIQAPESIPKNYIQFTKQAKKMDMKKLKAAIWSCLTNGKSDYATLKKVVPIEKNCFSEIYKWLKLNLTEKMRKDLSSPLAFAALLHLCNECDLELVQQPDLKDVQIKSINVKGG